MAAQPLIGWLADKVNRYTLIFACALVVLLGALSLPFIIDTHIIVWPVMLVWGGAIAGIYTVALAIMGQTISWSAARGWKRRIRRDVGSCRHVGAWISRICYVNLGREWLCDRHGNRSQFIFATAVDSTNRLFQLNVNQEHSL